ncbi:hypothetical protein DXG03_007268 [Asterophora parasitica]|uniref:GDS1 winged helix domain-containing protein n=1 Tax=Asterophora parasitica TaxID=117018 RepID=A0A9P7G862_9AGAR|nr:hypothetical protein DXG03_007268 [Asterophora parasitica]
MDPRPSTSTLDSPAPHSYATRIRQNIVIKPSIRLRQSPDPRPRPSKLANPATPATPQQPAALPQFPPPGIVLHPDDATSKVFLAIGRSFLSVDNRAMTIKDLAEMTVTFGLVCQNVSAASQAITTYIRSHIQRCEDQQDQPLLLRHLLSGTASDDDLLPGLHSRSGGAQCNNQPDSKRTNFRRGTAVWYMSRTTGAPCPFARAGIRLCDYAEAGTENSAKEKKQKERGRQAEQCGQKRKRPLRGCTTRDADSDHDVDRPPPKVKLIVRLKPLHCRSNSTSTTTTTTNHTSANHTRSATIDLSQDSLDSASDSDSDSSDDDSMSVDDSSSLSDEDEAPSPPQTQAEAEQSWCLPPYPRKSIYIPPYTPSTDEPYPQVHWPAASSDPYRRSPSAYSVGSPPPDSEDEDDDFHITMTGARRHSTLPSHPADIDEWDADDSDADADYAESPGPRSPSAPVMLPEVAVKEEPTDVQGIVAAWDDFDDSLAGAKVAEVIAQAAAASIETRIKSEPFDSWSWESASHDWPLGAESELGTRVKQEDIDLDNSFYPSLHTQFALRPPFPVSPLSQLPGLSYSDSPSPEGSSMHDMDMDAADQYATLRPPARNQPKSLSFPTTPPPTSAHSIKSLSLPLSSSPAAFTPAPTPAPSSQPLLAPTPQHSQSLASLIQSITINSPIAPIAPSAPTTAIAPFSLLMSPPPTCISPHQTHGNPLSDVVVVHTCQPCTPAISATQIEGISVYQMSLGPYQLLRRIDTDFVNISPIVAYTGSGNDTPWPPSLNAHTVPNATTVTKGSPAVSGTWVPLRTAQAFVRDHHHLPRPPTKKNNAQAQQTRKALRTFLGDSLFERFPSALKDFHRSSTQGRMLGHFGPHFGSTLQATQLCEARSERERSESVSVVSGNGIGGAASVGGSVGVSGEAEAEDTPLSATEQEIFRALCDIPDWDKENSPPSSPMLVEQKIAGTSTPVIVKAVAAAAAMAPSPVTDDTAIEPVMEIEVPPPAAVEPAKQTAPAPVPAPESSERADRPLRRSKRVADAIAAHTQPRTRSRRGGSRNSLS